MDAALFNLNGNNVELSLTNLDRIVSGPEEAVQLVAFHLFTDPGSCLFAKEDGGGVLRLIDGRIIRRSELQNEAIVAVRRARDSILRNQDASKPSDALVTDLNFVNLEVEGNTKIKLRVRITLAIGRTFTVNLLSPES